MNTGCIHSYDHSMSKRKILLIISGFDAHEFGFRLLYILNPTLLENVGPFFFQQIGVTQYG